MANTIARCVGQDRTRTKEATRMGSECASGAASTWRTFTTCTVWADGHGYVEVRRDQVVIHRFEFEAEL